MTTNPLVYLVDPSSRERDHVTRELEEFDLETQSFSDADTFLTQFELGRVGCVLTEMRLGNATAFQLVKHLRHRSSSLPVILLTSHASVPLAVQAFKEGLFDLLEKPSKGFQLWECATRAFEHHKELMSQSCHRHDIKNRLSELTRQEFQVMQMILEGEQNKRIAAKLSVSPRTIVFRRKSLMKKMNANSIAELASLIHCVSGEIPPLSTSDTTLLFDAQVAANGAAKQY